MRKITRKEKEGIMIAFAFGCTLLTAFMKTAIESMYENMTPEEKAKFNNMLEDAAQTIPNPQDLFKGNKPDAIGIIQYKGLENRSLAQLEAIKQQLLDEERYEEITAVQKLINQKQLSNDNN